MESCKLLRNRSPFKGQWAAADGNSSVVKFRHPARAAAVDDSPPTSVRQIIALG
jgi:hypothetical protein